MVVSQGVANLASSSLRKIVIEVSDLSLAWGTTESLLRTSSGLHYMTERGFWVMGNALGMQKLKCFTITSCHRSWSGSNRQPPWPEATVSPQVTFLMLGFNHLLRL